MPRMGMIATGGSVGAAMSAQVLFREKCYGTVVIDCCCAAILVDTHHINAYYIVAQLISTAAATNCKHMKRWCSLSETASDSCYTLAAVLDLL